MQRPEKAPEPSMEEILASIRKIIAEEPVGVRPGQAPDSPGSDRSAPGPGFDNPSNRAGAAPASSDLDGGEHASDDPPFSVEDALADLIDDTPHHRIEPLSGRDALAPKPGARPAAPAADEGQRPSWLFARPGASAVEARSAAARGVGDHPGRLDIMAERNPKTTGTQKPSDPSALFGREREAGRTGAGDPAALPPAYSQDVPGPGPFRVPARETDASGQNGSVGAGLAAPAAGLRPGTTFAQPVKREPAPDAGAGAKAGAKVGDGPAVVTAPPAERPKAADLQPAGPSRDSVPATAPPSGNGQAKDASPLNSPARGLVPAAPGIGPEAAGSAGDAQPKPVSSASGSAARTLEEAVADLLRPMLRDWLDANMPRIVEKALRVELAAGGKRPGTDDPR